MIWLPHQKANCPVVTDLTGVNATVNSKEGSITLATWCTGPDQRRPKCVGTSGRTTFRFGMAYELVDPTLSRQILQSTTELIPNTLAGFRFQVEVKTFPALTQSVC